MNSAIASNGRSTETMNEEFDSARRAALYAFGKFLEARKHLQAAAVAAGIELGETAGGQLHEVLDTAKVQTAELYENTGQFIRNNPFTSIAIAFSSGVVLARLLGR